MARRQIDAAFLGIVAVLVLFLYVAGVWIVDASANYENQRWSDLGRERDRSNLESVDPDYLRERGIEIPGR